MPIVAVVVVVVVVVVGAALRSDAITNSMRLQFRDMLFATTITQLGEPISSVIQKKQNVCC